MGYGHQRTSFPLRYLAVDGKVINANDYQGIPKKDREIWESIRKGYEFVSNFKKFPLLGPLVFFLTDRFQKILTFYPKRDLSKPNSQLKQTIATIKTGWGRDLIEKFKIQNSKSKINLPLISTFFTPAYMAEYFGYPGEIFCVVCDADISRTWAPFNPKESKIKYFAPTERVVERLKLYGVKEENIFFTGYPLPLENIGSENLEILKEDLRYRLLNLDPQKKYFEKYEILIRAKLGKLPEKPDHPLTILFSVGGAGAQKEIGIKIVKSLAEKIKKKEVRIILSAGIRKKVKEYFERKINKVYTGLTCVELNTGQTGVNSGVEILFGKDIDDYFQKFNFALRKTDILWTKPSELSFYAGLGLPIIIAPPIGSQEEFNMRWLLKSGFGLKQENPNYTSQWLFDWISQGYLAEAAFQGFIEGEKLGTYNIQKIIEKCSG
jgi:hypothetical protein